MLLTLNRQHCVVASKKILSKQATFLGLFLVVIFMSEGRNNKYSGGDEQRVTTVTTCQAKAKKLVP